MPGATFTATLLRDEAILRFPYDEGLRCLLRAIPGRRWDPLERAWCIPLGPEQAAALSLLLAALPGEPEVSDELARALRRRRSRRARRECQIELARPDEDWWLSFATDGPEAAVRALLGHPGARALGPIGRALVPLDERSIRIVEELDAAGTLRLSAAARRALEQRREPAAEPARRPDAADVEFRRDRSGCHWLLVGAAHAPLARALADRLGLSARAARDGSLGLAALERDAEQLTELLGQLEQARVAERVRQWLRRARTWRGTVEVHGPAGAPAFLLLGESERLPRALRELATPAAGGASVPLSAASRALVADLDAWITPAARRCIAALEEGRPAPAAVLERSSVHEQPTFVLAPGHDGGRIERFARLEGVLSPRARAGAGGEHAGLWALRADPFCVPALDRFLAGGEVWVDPQALELLQEIREQHAEAAGLVALSAADDAELRVPGLAGELKPFQRAGVAYALERRRAFIADEQGLGKTIEALAALEADGAYPAVVVCPASLKLNWLREIGRWLPRRSVELVSGTGAREHAPAADITIVNYDILAARLAQLSATAPRALVLDESHYCKNAAAKRTQAVHGLASAVAPDGLVLALTGTPVTNRPAELISQLRILGRLDDFGTGAQFSERFRGPDAHLRLHWHLRARCFSRRLKADVLPQLPAKTRSVVPVELDNEAEYRLAERDLVAWLQTQPLDLRELDARVAAALRAERLVRVGALKLLAARGKLRASLAWIHDFCSSGERLVVFAHHREIQRALLERFPNALHILGDDGAGARERALEAFQDADRSDNQLIVCSIHVAGQGLTLTRASSVAFLELDWTPARHDQAEDRCHRIGQKDAVNAYYLLAAETIDETIATLLERKRAVIGAVTDGRDDGQESMLDALVRELRATPFRHLRAVA